MSQNDLTTDVIRTQPQPAPWLVWFCVGTSTLIAALDGTMMGLALPNISHALRISLPDTQWVILAYMLSISVLLLPVSKLSERFGNHRLFTLGLFLYGLFSAICGFAPTIWTLLLARVFQGVGAALFMSMGAVILSQAFGRNMGKPMAGLNVIFAVASIAAPLITSYTLSHSSWHVLFWLSLPICALGLLLSFWVLKPQHEVSAPDCQAFDWFGSLASMLSLGGLLYLLTYGVKQWHMWPVNSAVALMVLVVGTWFFRHIQAFHNPVLSLHVFRSPAVQATCLSSMAVFAVTSLTTFLLPFYLLGKAGQGLSQANMGWMVMLFPLGLTLTSPLSGFLSDRFGSKKLSVSGMIGILLLGASMTLFYSRMPLVFVILQQLTFGMVSGLFHSPNNRAVVLAFEAIGAGALSGSMITLMRSLGHTLGITVIGLCFLTAGSELFATTRAFYDGLFWSSVTTAAFLVLVLFLQRRAACDRESFSLS